MGKYTDEKMNEVCEVALVNLFTLVKGYKEIRIEVKNLESYKTKCAIMTARNLESITGYPIFFKINFWELFSLKLWNKRFRDIKRTKGLAVDIEKLMDDVQKAKEVDEDIWEEIFKAFYKEK